VCWPHKREVGRQMPGGKNASRSDNRQDGKRGFRADGATREQHTARERDVDYLQPSGRGRVLVNIHDPCTARSVCANWRSRTWHKTGNTRPISAATCDSAVAGALAIQRSSWSGPARILSHQLGLMGTQNCRRSAVKKYLSRNWSAALVRHGADPTSMIDTRRPRAEASDRF